VTEIHIMVRCDRADDERDRADAATATLTMPITRSITSSISVCVVTVKSSSPS